MIKLKQSHIRIMCLFVFGVVAVIALNMVLDVLADIYQAQLPDFIDEKVPEIVSKADNPVLLPYVHEFSGKVTRESAFFGAYPEVPYISPRPPGAVFFVDHETNTSTWGISTHEGPTWQDQQRFFIYFQNSNRLEEVTCFKGRVLGWFKVFSESSYPGSFVIVNVWAKGNVWDTREDGIGGEDNNELWIYEIQSKKARLISSGTIADAPLSPDCSKLVFERYKDFGNFSPDYGFLCLYLWDLHAMRIAPIISLLELEPGSGHSWSWRWSEDSQMLHLAGSCRGFTRAESSKPFDFNLVYSTKEKKFYTLK